jgi:penicillin-binding protein 2
MLQAMAGGEPPLEAYPKSDRGRIATQQEELRDTAPETSASVAGDDQA